MVAAETVTCLPPPPPPPPPSKLVQRRPLNRSDGPYPTGVSHYPPPPRAVRLRNDSTDSLLDVDSGSADMAGCSAGITTVRAAAPTRRLSPPIMHHHHGVQRRHSPPVLVKPSPSVMHHHHHPRGLSSPHNKKSSSSSIWEILFTLTSVVVGIALLVALFFAGYQAVSGYLDYRVEVLRKDIRIQEYDSLSKSVDRKVQTLEQDNQALRQQLSQAEAHSAQLQTELSAAVERQAEIPVEWQEKTRLLHRRTDKYKESIQALSKRAVYHRFGTDRYLYVAMQLGFAASPENEQDRERVILQLASAEEMPHTVYWFLEQVSQGLYDGTSFHLSANHVIQAGPANFHSEGSHAHEDFEAAGFASLLMQEYSDHWPHRAYTLGYAGRPGGPDFYVNMQDNSDIHGPGGQDGYEDASEADPCFAKVVGGRRAIDRIHHGQVHDNGSLQLVHPVTIVNMQIISSEEAHNHMDQ